MDSSERSDTTVSGAGDDNQQSERPGNSHVEGAADADNRNGELRTASFGKNEMLKALEVVERDSMAIAQSFTSLFASLRTTLSEATSNSIEHMSCFNDAAGRLQECALDAATKGNRYINSSLRLNEEMKGIENLAGQLKILRRNVDALDTAVNRLTRFP
nr:Filamin A-interacting protein [Ipomoea batatas]